MYICMNFQVLGLQFVTSRVHAARLAALVLKVLCSFHVRASVTPYCACAHTHTHTNTTQTFVDLQLKLSCVCEALHIQSSSY